MRDESASQTIPPRSSSGWLLVGLIVLISAVILALAGMTFYLTEHLRTTSLRQNKTKAFYLAQAGVMSALYNFRKGLNVPAGGPQPVGAGPDTYTLQQVDVGSSRKDFVLINMRPIKLAPSTSFSSGVTFCGVTGERMQDWRVRNVLASGGSAWEIASFKVNWPSALPPSSDPDKIMRLDLNGTGQTWPPSGAGCVFADRDTPISLSGVALSKRTLSPGNRWGTNRVWFTSAVMDTKDWIDITFTMKDSFSRTSRWDRVTLTNSQADFTIKSVGTVQGGVFPFTVWRRVQAEYRVCALAVALGTSCNNDAEELADQEGAIISYQERTTLTDP